MIRPATALAAAVFALTVSAAALAGPLSSNEWRPIEIFGAEPGAGIDFSVSFDDDGNLTGRSGCNSFFATYETDGRALDFGPIGTTMMACPEPVMEAEAGFLKIFPFVTSFEIGQRVLYLRGPDGTAYMVLASTDTTSLQALAGSKWLPASIRGSEIPGGTGAFVRFSTENQLTGNGGCNRFTGEFTAGDGSIEIGPLATTRMACQGPAMELESRFLDALSQARSYEATHLTLILRDADDNTIARLSRTDAD